MKLSSIADIIKVHPYTMSETKTANHHARLDIHTDYSFGIFSAVEVKEDNIVPLDFAFYLTNCSLLIVCNDGNSLLGDFIENFSDSDFIPQYAEAYTTDTTLYPLLTDVIRK